MTVHNGRAAASWLLGATRDRMRAQWRLILAVLLVAVLANTLITTLGLLVTATEQQGTRGALDAIPAERTTIDIRLVDLAVSAEDARAATTDAVRTVLGDSIPVTSTAAAITQFFGAGDRIGYFSQLEGVEQHARLVSGSWASGAGVALPQAAATALGLTVGDSVTLDVDESPLTVEVVGIYAAAEDDAYWNLDPLRGGGFDAVYPKPGVTFYSPIEAFGPLVVAPGALAEAGIPVSSLQLYFQPDFSTAGVDDLAPLLNRLESASVDIRLDSGRVAERMLYATDVDGVVSSVTSGLVVTRSTVIVVSLLLAVLAIAAMAQAARLLSDSRTVERRLMRSRGAGAGHIVAVTAVEAGVVAVLAAAASPLLAVLAYRLTAAQPAMRAAGMPPSAPITPLAIATAAAVSLLLVIVLIAPLVGRARAIAEDDQTAARPRRATGLMRSGLDLALVVLAGLAYWQLVSYGGVVDTAAALSIDPILAIGPALVLLAAALLCVRLIPLVAVVIEKLGSRSNGTIVPLASWELGRRSTRAVAAVLLLSLAIGVGSFGLTFRATWQQSQLDQAAVAVGPPVRVTTDGSAPSGDGSAVLRRGALLAADNDDEQSSGSVVQLLGLSEGARDLVDQGRLAEVGGEDIARLVRSPLEPTMGIALPAGAKQLTVTVQLDGELDVLAGAGAELRAILQDSSGAISTTSFGLVPVDGAEYAVSAPLPGGAGMSLVGIQSVFDGQFADGDPTVLASVQVGLAQLAADGSPLALDAAAGWAAVASDAADEDPTRLDGLGFAMTVAAARTSAFSLVGWVPQLAVGALVPRQLSEDYHLEFGSQLTLRTQAVNIEITVSGFTDLVPGAATDAELDATGYGLGSGTSGSSTVVVDQEALARALAQSGVEGTMIDEWWLSHAPTVLPEGATAYSAEALGVQLQQSPLRVATQAALWVSIAAGALLAALGFAMHSAATLRARRIELAQLRAIGLSRPGLIALVGAESLLLCVLGVVFGVAIGILLAFLVGPLVAVSPNGTPPVPSVVVVIPAQGIALLTLLMVAVLGLVVVAVARAQKYTRPADLLRGGVDA